MLLFDVTKQAALEKDSSAYCLRYVKQLLCVCGDSKACQGTDSVSRQTRRARVAFFLSLMPFFNTLSMLTAGANLSVCVFSLSRRK